MLEVLQGLLGLLLVVVAALLIPPLLRVRDGLCAVLAGLVVAASAVVSVSVGLSLVGELSIATSFLVVAAALFAVRGLRDRRLGELVVAACARRQPGIAGAAHRPRA